MKNTKNSEKNNTKGGRHRCVFKDTEICENTGQKEGTCQWVVNYWNFAKRSFSSLTPPTPLHFFVSWALFWWRGQLGSLEEGVGWLNGSDLRLVVFYNTIMGYEHEILPGRQETGNIFMQMKVSKSRFLINPWPPKKVWNCFRGTCCDVTMLLGFSSGFPYTYDPIAEQVTNWSNYCNWAEITLLKKALFTYCFDLKRFPYQNPFQKLNDMVIYLLLRFIWMSKNHCYD